MYRMSNSKTGTRKNPRDMNDPELTEFIAGFLNGGAVMVGVISDITLVPLDLVNGLIDRHPELRGQWNVVKSRKISARHSQFSGVRAK